MPEKKMEIPEPLLETTLTLLDSVTYSRISRGLGGLIFPPSSQPGGDETKQKRDISHCLGLR